MDIYSNFQIPNLVCKDYEPNLSYKSDDLLILFVNDFDDESINKLKVNKSYKLIVCSENYDLPVHFQNAVYVNDIKKVNSKLISKLKKEIESSNKIKLVLCTHKDYKFPISFIYYPTIVGVGYDKTNLCLKYQKDNFFDENISEKNKFFCELTSIFPFFKQNDYDILGLVHYRRLFVKNNHCKKSLQNVLDHESINKYLTKYDIILPKKRHYYIETNFSHYIHAHEKEPLLQTKMIISEKYPEYLPYFKKHMKRTTGHYFNMFVAKKDIADGYLNFMFNILFELEKRIDISGYSESEQRVFGYVSELLIDVYVLKNKLKVKNLNYLFFDKQNWFKKGFNFIKRKISKK